MFILQRNKSRPTFDFYDRLSLLIEKVDALNKTSHYNHRCFFLNLYNELDVSFVMGDDIRTASHYKAKENKLPNKSPITILEKRGVKFKLFCLSLPMYLYCHSSEMKHVIWNHWCSLCVQLFANATIDLVVQLY